MIKISNLTKKYGEKVALKNISFEAEKGEIVGFLGPNGAGKTTTMRIITGFIPPSSGTVEVGGIDVLEEPEEAKKKIGYLPENNPLYLDMEVERFLDYFAQLKHIEKKDRKGEINRVINECGLSDVRGEIIGRLSKGYKQRVGLAQALLGDPEVLILDEPTIGLDPKQVVEIRNLIKELGGKRTVLLSTHILPEVSATCNRVIIINEGRIIATDTPERLTSSLYGGERVHLVVKGPTLEIIGFLENIEGVTKVWKEKERGEISSLIIESKMGTDLRSRIAAGIVNSGWELLELRKETLELEDIFLKLTTRD